MSECPKCQAPYSQEEIDCKKCGIVFVKYEKLQAERARKRAELLTTCRACEKEISKNAGSCPHCGEPLEPVKSTPEKNTTSAQPKENKKRPSLIVTFGGGFIAFCLFIVMFGESLGLKTSPPPTVHTRPSSYSPPDPKAAVRQALSLDFAWEKKGFDNIMAADFTIKNTSNQDIKDVEITCRHYSKSKTMIDSNTRTIYEVFKKQSTRTIEGFDMGFIHSQANTSSCSIDDFTLL